MKNNFFGTKVVEVSCNHPKFVVLISLIITFIIALLASLPTIFPQKVTFLPSLKVDTDPENMLKKDEPVRVFHNKMKKLMNIHDMVIVGVVNEEDPDGVFNPKSLKKIYELTQFAKKIRWKSKKDKKYHGVIPSDIIAPSTVDNIEQGGLGTVKFEWLMKVPPKTREEAIKIREKALRIPFLKDTMVSKDGKAICLYFPITSKDVSYEVSKELKEKISNFTGPEKFYITGLPVAEDTFGVEMFKEMAISGPIAALVIFLLLWVFFRKVVLIISPMIIAIISVIITMGLLIITGNTIHIMSSMIPIFLIPIAVLDAVHILSDFFDNYQKLKDRKKTILKVMRELFVPMLYTSLTTAVGFASLALTPIPPVQVFGIFVAFGVMVAWILTITFIPASVMFIKEKSLLNFGLSHTTEKSTLLDRILSWLGGVTYRKAKLILGISLILAVIGGYGTSLINVNDNPIKWFTSSHPIRIADKVINSHFGGSYLAYLALIAPEQKITPLDYQKEIMKALKDKESELLRFNKKTKDVFEIFEKKLLELVKKVKDTNKLDEELNKFIEKRLESSDFEEAEIWDEISLILDKQRQKKEIFKQPQVLKYIEKLQNYLLSTGIVGKSNSLSDIVKTVYRELFLGKKEYFKIPNTPNAIAQCLITYQNSHRPQDLWHFVTPDFTKSVIWVQLKSGDNKDMSKVAQEVKNFFKENPPPFNIHHKWFGLTYINVIWQHKMVLGMLEAFLGSFLVVLLMMTLLFGSSLWGILSMVPLGLTILFIYGTIGIIGKDYDMPVAVLSSLSLGLAVDYAIHFLARGREMYERYGNWEATATSIFGEPARAISRNAIVVGIGFLPLIFAPLVPYKTVGILIASILFVAGITSLFLLPAAISVLEKWMFPKTKVCCFVCNTATCVVTIIAFVLLIAVNIHQFSNIGWNQLSWMSLASIGILMVLCGILRHIKKCKV